MQQTKKRLLRNSFLKIMVISIIPITVFLSSPFYLQSSYAAAIAIKQVQGFGDSLERFTCSNGQRPFGGSLINEIITFNAVQTQGQSVSGQFTIEGVDANGASKQD